MGTINLADNEQAFLIAFFRTLKRNVMDWSRGRPPRIRASLRAKDSGGRRGREKCD